MKITRTSSLTTKVRTLELDVTPDQLGRWEQGELIQVAMPQLNADEREFIMTGITPDEWDSMWEKAQ